MRLSSDQPDTDRPFSVNATGFESGCAEALRTAKATTPSSRDFLREVLDDGESRIRRRLAEPADGRIHHRLRQLGQERLVPRGTLHELERLDGSDATGRALTAGFPGKESHEVARGI